MTTQELEDEYLPEYKTLPEGELDFRFIFRGRHVWALSHGYAWVVFSQSPLPGFEDQLIQVWWFTNYFKDRPKREFTIPDSTAKDGLRRLSNGEYMRVAEARKAWEALVRLGGWTAFSGDIHK